MAYGGKEEIAAAVARFFCFRAMSHQPSSMNFSRI